MEEIIISSLVKNEDFVRIAMPFLEDEYFSQQHHKVLFKVITNYVKKYNKPPTIEAVKVEVENLNLIEPIYNASVLSLDNISEETNDLQWLVEKTEQWCQDRSLYNAIMRAVKVYDGSDSDLTRSGLPELMSKALSVSFDTTIGHDYIENWEDRYDLYTKKDERLPFDIDMLNTITDGGVTKKTSNLIIGGTGTGKTLGLCHLAASYMNDGKNVLYITLEMSEDKISQRIDANLMNTDIADIKLLPKDVYEKKIQRIKKNTPGKLIVKEYPTATANSNHFRHLINELKLKKKFNIDVLMVDYLNICTSARYKGGNHNSYTIAKSIAEELRGLAIEFNCVLWTATQSTRQSNVASDFEIDGISECIYVNEKIRLVDGNEKKISEAKLGDKVTSHDDYKVITKRHHVKMKDCIKITTKSGKSITVSKDHKFPVKSANGEVSRLSYNEGLSIGYFLSTKTGH